MSVVNKFKEIVSGWKNLVFKDPVIEKLANERAFICAGCPLNINSVCDSSIEGEVIEDFTYGDVLRKKGDIHKGCNCPLDAKTRSESSKCPLGKW